MYNIAQEIKFNQADQPIDSVSQIVFNSYVNDTLFIASSWDGYIRYYEIHRPKNLQEVRKLWQIYLHYPVICCDFSEEDIIFAGLSSGEVLAIRVKNSHVQVLGKHEAPVCALFWIKPHKMLISLGFDSCIKFWSQNTVGLQHEITLPAKTFAASFSYPFLLIASQDSYTIMNFTSLQSLQIPEYKSVANNKYEKILCCRISYQMQRYILGTSTGRLIHTVFGSNSKQSIISNSTLEARSQRMSFQNYIIYGQVNCVDIGPMSSISFGAVGGSDDMSLYTFPANQMMKKKKQLSPKTCTACRISNDKKYLVYAIGNDWQKGTSNMQQSGKQIKLVAYRVIGKELTSPATIN